MAYPILGDSTTDMDFAPVDLSADNPILGAGDIKSLADYVAQVQKETGCPYLHGGYLERRRLYQSDLFTADEVRDIHLGIDIWAPAGTEIYAPIDGVIHSFGYNDNGLDYGYTLIIAHEGYHTLYGHLSSEYHSAWSIGASVQAGQIIASLGDYDENGGWPPHLHFQKIISLDGNIGDYPGVCSAMEVDHYASNCPDPSDLLSFLH